MRLIGFAVVLALTAILAPLAAEQQGGGCTGLAFCTEDRSAREHLCSSRRSASWGG